MRIRCARCGARAALDRQGSGRWRVVHGDTFLEKCVNRAAFFGPEGEQCPELLAAVREVVWRRPRRWFGIAEGP